ncbi:MAG: preprotein translocase subunit SecA [Candidatus Pacebacteria bacterium]|nr:preprotein translocase subunit SecA [Candidatus Paceibacterota bacterium]MBP9840711.1 preprotein translocase subunit SecA [Candidatus Paceibacterota bacterium]
MAGFLSGLFNKNQSAGFVRSAAPVLEVAANLEAELTPLSEEAIRARLLSVRERTGGMPERDADIAEVFALVREASRRTLGQRHYDVQLVGGLALARGRIAEMRTGEGKTLVATLAVVLRALAGKGVHVVTVNDFLARRDTAWMGQIYQYLGLSTGVVTSSGSFIYDPAHVAPTEDADRDEAGSFKVFQDYLRPVSKKEAYAADITYATNNELGFDYLRDNTSFEVSQLVQRGHHYAIVDEIDSILIDEARTPLIISGPAADAEGLYERFASIAERLKEEEDYTLDEKQRAVQITEGGINKAEKALGIENLYTEGGMKYAHHLETAVRAKALFHKNKEYVVQGEEIVIVDEFTGRMQPGRRWSEGLHQAIEAKERVPIKKETRTYASVTFQNYFRMYEQLAGMTGTALSSEEEFYTVYKLEVVAIPTHKPVLRKDHDDLIFQTARGKYMAVAREVKALQEKGQPVLIGTVSIEDNEVVSQFLEKEGVVHEVLNAKNHEREGEIIAQAGRKGQVTVATNLAGRGVDIKLGGIPATPESYEEIVRIGGLAVIGTERHEARRIDNQLRGRSGRQGDPGETRFFVSLEDRLMRVFAADTMKKVMGTFGLKEDEPLESRMISRSLEAAQKRIEGFNFDSRKNTLAYDDVLNTQRLSVYAKRRTAVTGSVEEVEAYVTSLLTEEERAVYEAKKAKIGAEPFVAVLRRIILQVTDTFWLEQLESMDYLRRSVGLRAYGQRDPLIEYRKEGLARFRQMEAGIAQGIAETIPRIEVIDESKIRADEEKTRAKLVTAGAADDGVKAPILKANTPNRNDTVTIRKGEETREMKYKKAEPLLSEGWELV